MNVHWTAVAVPLVIYAIPNMMCKFFMINVFEFYMINLIEIVHIFYEF